MTDLYFNSEARTSGLLSSIFSSILDLVFPPYCSGCGRVDTRWCDRCLDELNAVPVHLHTRSVEGLEWIAATGRHKGKLQQAVQALKYDGAVELRSPLGRRLAEVLVQLRWPVDAVVAVPMHPSRLAERGYNQAFLLAQALADITDIVCLDDALQRTRATRSQVGLNQEERLYNLTGAFSAHPNAVRGKSLLIIDDVCTTGTTLAGSAQAALDAGAIAVYALTVTEA